MSRVYLLWLMITVAAFAVGWYLPHAGPIVYDAFRLR